MFTAFIKIFPKLCCHCKTTKKSSKLVLTGLVIFLNCYIFQTRNALIAEQQSNIVAAISTRSMQFPPPPILMPPQMNLQQPAMPHSPSRHVASPRSTGPPPVAPVAPGSKLDKVPFKSCVPRTTFRSQGLADILVLSKSISGSSSKKLWSPLSSNKEVDGLDYFYWGGGESGLILIINFSGKITPNFALYSGDPNIGQVRYSNGWFCLEPGSDY
jgi:hypothetical protein